MAMNALDKLADQDVPDKPSELTSQVHERLNPWLFSTHLMDFAFRAMPFAFLFFLQALAGAMQYSLTGRFPNRGDDHAKRTD